MAESREEKQASEYPITDLGLDEPQLGSRGVAMVGKEGTWGHNSFPDGQGIIDGNIFPGLPESKDLPSFPETFSGPEVEEQEGPGKTETEEQPEKQEGPVEQPRNPETTSPAPPTLKLENDSVIVTPPEDEDVAAVELDGIFIFDEESQGYLFPKATKFFDEWKLSDMGRLNGIKLDPKTGQWTIPLDSLVKGELLILHLNYTAWKNYHHHKRIPKRVFRKKQFII